MKTIQVLSLSFALVAPALAAPLRERDIATASVIDWVTTTKWETKIVWATQAPQQPPVGASNFEAWQNQPNPAPPAPTEAPSPTANNVAPPPSPKPTPQTSQVDIPPPKPSPAPEPTTSQAPPPPPPPPSPKPVAPSAPAPAPPAPKPTVSASSSDSSSGGSGGSFTGEGTFYTPGMGSCGIVSSESEDVVAIGTGYMSQFNGGNPNLNPKCGKTITISYGGHTSTAKIVDTCAGCAGAYDVDMSPTLFSKFADQSVGRIQGLTWSFA